MWEMIASALLDGMKKASDQVKGSATPQGQNVADNVAAGASNSGWGSMAKDLAGGNYASAAGNAVQMGQNNSNQNIAAAGQAPQMSAPIGGPVSAPGSIMPGPVGVQRSPFLQQMMNRYMGA